MKKINSLLLTAGFSSRMKMDKALIKIENEYFINIIISKLILVSDNIFIVLGHHSDLIRKEIKKEFLEYITFIFNENYTDGMYSSIKKGVESSDNHTLIHMIDQPFISSNFYIDFVDNFKDEFMISQPLHNNKVGHPIILNKDIIKMMATTNDNNLRDFLKPFRDKMNVFVTDEEAIFHNINNPEILKKIISN